MKDKVNTLLILLYLTTVSLSQIKSDESNSNPCTSKDTCSECITANPQCGWCMKKGNFSHHRCDFINRLSDNGCLDQIFFPNPSLTIIDDKELSNKIRHNADPIQLKPQRVHLRIRPNLPYSVKFEFKQALHYPVDLSKSMENNKISIELKDNATNNVKIRYFSSCLNQKKEETNICRGFRVVDTVNFEAKIEATYCARSPKEWNETIRIYPVGLNDALIINLEMICECDCEKSWNEEPDSAFCERRGTYECGVCGCYANSYGRRCECDAKDLILLNPAEEKQNCIRGNDTKVCSGRGACRCGECECYKREAPEEVTGKYCECDNFSCHRYDGKVCSGLDHGTCVCGTCLCNEDWTQPDCSCRKSNIDCIDPNTNRECNGRGKCVCGVCICEPSGDEQYTGQYCEDCPTCKSQCETYKECVQCRIHQTGPLNETDECNNCLINPIGTSEFDVQEGEQLCVFIDDDDCKFQFKYKYKYEYLFYVIAQNTRDCPEPSDANIISKLNSFNIILYTVILFIVYAFI